ncbi:MAG: alginate export family protein [Novosphingobium sp.]|nr:alginate export family protein [Novosphingobium sp.]
MHGKTIALGMMLLGANPAAAEPVKVTPLIDTRLRYEAVDQDGLPREADAVTARVRAGVQADAGAFSALIEGEGLLAIVERYNSGTNGRTAHPLVVDPQNIELNRAQIQVRAVAGTVVTAGRQRINLDDQRFVGAVAWRQNEQTFDAVRAEWTGVARLKVDATYLWSVRTINGIDGFGARPTAIGGDSVLVNVSYKTKPVTITGFAYLIEQERAVLRANSGQTYGLRAAGALPVGQDTRVTYTASYARQSDTANHPIDYSSDYRLGEFGIEHKALRLSAGYEALGAGKDGAPAAFQTPLATLHKFQGFADKFLTTPPGGIRDKYATIGLVLPRPAGIGPITASVIYHRFDSDRGGIRYGDEIDFVATAKLGRTLFLVKYADYDARGFATDTRKFWVSAEWAF